MLGVRRREFITLLGGAAVAWPLAARAQQSERSRNVGVLVGLREDDPDTQARLVGLRAGLERLGWSEGRNIRIHYRFAPPGTQTQVLAKELVALQPDVLLGQASPATRALQEETPTIPIVFVGVADPIGSGFVVSLANPGGNTTGFLLFEASITGKWLAMLKDISPGLVHAALVINPKTAPYYKFYLNAGEAAASSLGIELVFAPVGTRPQTSAGVRNVRPRAERGSCSSAGYQHQISQRSSRRACGPAPVARCYSDRLFVMGGGLMCYSTDRADQFRMAASYIDRILRGAKPSDLPVQVPAKYETVVNLKTAKALGLTVPPTLLVAADEVIECPTARVHHAARRRGGGVATWGARAAGRADAADRGIDGRRRCGGAVAGVDFAPRTAGTRSRANRPAPGRTWPPPPVGRCGARATRAGRNSRRGFSGYNGTNHKRIYCAGNAPTDSLGERPTVGLSPPEEKHSS